MFYSLPPAIQPTDGNGACVSSVDWPIFQPDSKETDLRLKAIAAFAETIG